METYFDRTKNEFVGLELIRNDLLKEFPRVNIDVELKKMIVWLQSSKGKNHKGTPTFIRTWLSRAFPTLPVIELGPSLNAELNKLLSEYREELWKNNHQILALNSL